MSETSRPAQPNGKTKPEDPDNVALNFFRKERVPLEILLSTETTLNAVIISFGRYTVTVLDTDRPRQLVLQKANIVSMETTLPADRWRRLLQPPDGVK